MAWTGEPRTLGRREVLRTAFAGVTLATGLGELPLTARPAGAQARLTPEQALNAVMEGNARFVAGRMTSFQEDLDLLKQKNAEKQEPFAAVLSCADSRVPVEILFDQSIGHLFVTRVAGNVTTPEIIASLEYGAAVLGTRTILVLGHSACGAVSAAIAGKAAPGQISSLYAPLRPAVDQAGMDLDAAIRANALFQAGLLRTASPVLADLLKQGRLSVGAAYYDIASGRVTLIL